MYFVSAMERAFYYEGKSLSAGETYRGITIAHNLDPDLVIERMKVQDIINAAYADIEDVFLWSMYNAYLNEQVKGYIRSSQHLTLYYHYTPNIIKFIDCYSPISSRILLYASQKR